jgi:segregation and condensation protein A
LQLIERDQLDITDVALATVTEQYLQYLAQLNSISPSELNQFIELAAKLVYIKSEVLLPGPPSMEYQADLGELTDQLQEYRRYAQAGNQLGNMIRSRQSAWSRQAAPPAPAAGVIPMPPVTLADLQAAFQSAIQRMPRLPEESIAEPFSIEQAAQRIRAAVRQGAATLQTLFESAASQAEAVVTFLSLLELWKSGELRVVQERAFGDIIVTDG